MAWRYAGGVVLLWSAITLALSGGQYLDSQQLGKPKPFFSLLGLYWLSTLMQMVYTTATGLVLLRHPHWAARPLRLSLCALATVLPYLALSTPVAVLLAQTAHGLPLSDLMQGLRKWPALNIYVDALTAAGVLSLQLGWSFWQHAQLRRQQMLQAKAENLRLRLALLQGQLEPHFMFNTLNSIASLVRGAERPVALAALNRLSELLRYSLRASQKAWVSVADELAFVADLVALQALRFGAALRWQQQLQARDWARWACPPLLLQPLVEAAIRQGLESGVESPIQLAVDALEGRVTVKLSQQPASTAEQAPAEPLLPEVQAALDRVRERVQALFGAAADFNCLARAGGFVWCLSWPMRDLDDLSGPAESPEARA
jgi:hypothetical protein